MKDNLHDYMQLGIVHFMAYPDTMRGEGDVLGSLKKLARDADFDVAEITHIKDENTRREAKALLEQSHMTVLYGAQPILLIRGLNPNDLDESAREAAQNALFEAVDEAAYMGAKGISFLSSKWDAAHRNENYAQLLKTTVNTCRYAADKGIEVELEVFDYDLDKKSLIGPAPLAARFAADVRCVVSNFGLLADLSHLPQTYESSLFALRVMRPYITHLHIGSAVVTPGCAAFGDTHPRFGFPNGSNDVNELAEFLRVALDEGLLVDGQAEPMVVSFEVKPWEGEYSEIVIANAKRTLRRAWALV